MEKYLAYLGPQRHLWFFHILLGEKVSLDYVSQQFNTLDRHHQMASNSVNIMLFKRDIEQHNS